MSESKAIFIDVSKCIGCRACEVACERVHNGKSFINVNIIEDFRLSIPLNCRHCEKAPCMIVCPTDAIYRDSDGAIIVNPILCIGCRLCVIACPFGVPEFDRELKIMIKCDLCQDRRAKGLNPACVSTCPTDALIYASVEEYRETKQKMVISKIIEEARTKKEILKLGNIKV